MIILVLVFLFKSVVSYILVKYNIEKNYIRILDKLDIFQK